VGARARDGRDARAPPEYAQEARARAARRRSPWNLLLVPLVLAFWLLPAYGTARVLGTLYAAGHPDARFLLLPDGFRAGNARLLV